MNVTNEYADGGRLDQRNEASAHDVRLWGYDRAVLKQARLTPVEL